MSNDSNTTKDTKFVVGPWLTSSVQPDMNVNDVNCLTAEISNSIIKTNSLKRQLKQTLVNELNVAINTNSDNYSASISYCNIPDDVLSAVRIYYNTKGYKTEISKLIDVRDDVELITIQICWTPADKSDVKIHTFDMNLVDKELANIELPTAKQLRRDLVDKIKTDIKSFVPATGPFEYMRQIRPEQIQLFKSIGSDWYVVNLARYKLHCQHPLNNPDDVTYFFRLWRD